MNKLIYNEVYKILHKKTTLIFACFVVLQFLSIFIMSKVNNYYSVNQDKFSYEAAKERVKSINNDKHTEITNVESYIEDMSIIDSYKYYKKYGTKSWKRYIFDEEAKKYITCMNSYKYKNLAQDGYKNCKNNLKRVLYGVCS